MTNRKKLFTICFYLLSATWGIFCSILGLITVCILRLRKYKIKKWKYCWYVEVGKNWGGFSLGPFVVCNISPTEDIQYHEQGHSLQNCLYGPFMLFLVCIPSCIRYWYREILYKTNRKKYYKLPDYDSIWFEGQATHWGFKYIKNL